VTNPQTSSRLHGRPPCLVSSNQFCCNSHAKGHSRVPPDVHAKELAGFARGAEPPNRLPQTCRGAPDIPIPYGMSKSMLPTTTHPHTHTHTHMARVLHLALDSPRVAFCEEPSTNKTCENILAVRSCEEDPVLYQHPDGLLAESRNSNCEIDID
jgi:hypothetical protein